MKIQTMQQGLNVRKFLALFCGIVIITLIFSLKADTLKKFVAILTFSSKAENCKINDQLVPLFITNQVLDNIANIVWRTTKTITDDLHHNNNKLQLDNPEYIVLCLNDEDASAFLSEHFPQSVQDAFNALIPGAYKADLLRYCLLYKFGGIYSDVKQKFMRPVNQLYISTDTLVLTEDIPHGVHGMDSDVTQPGIQISFMITRSQQPVFRRAIDMIVENVKLRRYGNNFLDVTGPGLFYRALMLESSQKYIIPFVQTKNGTLVNRCGEVIIECKPDDTSKSFTSGSYTAQWQNKTIYKGQSVP